MSPLLFEVWVVQVVKIKYLCPNEKTFIPWIAIVVVLPLVFTSCARIPEENLKEEHRKLLEAHVKIIHLDTLQRTESGLYYTVLQQGTGGKNTDSAMVFVRETIRIYSITLWPVRKLQLPGS